MTTLPWIWRPDVPDAWFPELRFRSSVAVSPCSVRKNYVHP